MMTLMTGIFDVVMDQRKIVDEFHGCRGGHCLRRISSHRLAAKKAKSRTNEFSRFSGARTVMLILPAHMIAQYIAEKGRAILNGIPQLKLHCAAIRCEGPWQALFHAHGNEPILTAKKTDCQLRMPADSSTKLDETPSARYNYQFDIKSAD
jgi:hypothetical protein